MTEDQTPAEAEDYLEIRLPADTDTIIGLVPSEGGTAVVVQRKDGSILDDSHVSAALAGFSRQIAPASEKSDVTVTLSFQEGKASFSVEVDRDFTGDKALVANVLQQITDNLPDAIAGDQPVRSTSFAPTTAAAILFEDDGSDDVKIRLHENASAPRKLDFAFYRDAIRGFADELDRHA